MCRGHYNQLPIGAHFEFQFGMFSAERGELLIGHGMGSQRRWKKGVVKNERHDSVYSNALFTEDCKKLMLVLVSDARL